MLYKAKTKGVFDPDVKALYTMTLYLDDEDVCFFAPHPEEVRTLAVIYLEAKYPEMFSVFPKDRGDKYLLNRYFSERKIRKSTEKSGSIDYIIRKDNGHWDAGLRD